MLILEEDKKQQCLFSDLDLDEKDFKEEGLINNGFHLKNTQTLGFLTYSACNIADAFYRGINEGLALFDAGFHNYTSSPLTFIPLELLGSPKNFRSELENINFIQKVM